MASSYRSPGTGPSIDEAGKASRGSTNNKDSGKTARQRLTSDFSYDDASPIDLIRRLLQKIEDTDRSYDEHEPELACFAQRLSDAILNPGEGGVDVPALDRALRVFFREGFSDQEPPPGKDLTLREGAFIELSSLSRVIRHLRQARDRAADRIQVLGLPRNSRLKEALLALRRGMVSNIRQLMDVFKTLNTPISRQATRELVVRLKRLGLIDFCPRPDPHPNDPLMFKISLLGKETADALETGQSAVAGGSLPAAPSQLDEPAKEVAGLPIVFDKVRDHCVSILKEVDLIASVARVAHCGSAKTPVKCDLATCGIMICSPAMGRDFVVRAAPLADTVDRHLTMLAENLEAGGYVPSWVPDSAPAYSGIKPQ